MQQPPEPTSPKSHTGHAMGAFWVVRAHIATREEGGRGGWGFCRGLRCLAGPLATLGPGHAPTSRRVLGGPPGISSSDNSNKGKQKVRSKPGNKGWDCRSSLCPMAKIGGASKFPSHENSPAKLVPRRSLHQTAGGARCPSSLLR